MEQGDALPSPEIRPALDALGLDFLCEFLEVEVERHPENLAALGELGQLYTKTARYEKGLAVDRKLVALRPDDPTTHYNLACSLALLGEAAEALDALDRSVALGYASFNAALGESQTLAHETWLTAPQIAQWLAALPDAANSGDVYAVLEQP